MPAIELSDNEWGQVMQLISEGPWRVANPLLMKIGEQLRAQHTAIINPSALKANGPEKEVSHDE